MKTKPKEEKGETKEIKVEIQTMGRKYDFIINGYKISFTLPIYDTVGMHPLDILLKDFLTMTDTVKDLERFQSAPTKELPEGDPKVTLDDVLNPKDKDAGS